MKVLLGHCFYRTSAPSGEDAVYANERQLLVDTGIEVISYEKANDNIDAQGLLNKISIAKDCGWSSKAYKEMKSLVRENRPDVAHFHNTFPQMSPSVYRACREENVPVVQTLHNYRLVCPGAMLNRDGEPCELCLSGSFYPALKHRCYRDSLPATGTLVYMLLRNRLNGTYTDDVSRYIALTRFARLKLAEGGLPAHKIVTKPNFIEDQIIGPPPAEDQRSYGIFVGRLDQSKGVWTLLRAWKRTPSIPLKILGDGPERGQMEAYAKDHGLNIEFLGYRDKSTVMHHVRHARFQCLPSEWYEGFPMVILEAFCAGTPVIASDLGSLSEIVEHGKTGFKFPPRDPLRLSDYIQRLWSMPAEASELGGNARREYLDKYTPGANLQALVKIYREVMAD